MTIRENVAMIREKMDAAARAAGREPREVLLCAATKMNDAARVREAVAAGVDLCGENRVQELTQKLGEHAYDGVPVHFIGHLQTNKVRQVVGKVALIQSVDRMELLACINALLRRQGPQVDQVTLGNTALDLGACTLICGEKRVQLSARECLLPASVGGVHGLGAGGVRRQLEQLLLDVLTGPQGDAPQKGAVRMLFQPAAAGPAVADIEDAVLVQRQCAGVSGRPDTKLPQCLPPAVSSRASASTLQMQRFPRSETYSVRPSSERARPAAPATPPSTCSTVRADGSYT